MITFCDPRGAIEANVGAENIRQNPHVASGKQGFIDHVEEMTRDHPGKRVAFKRVIAEGDKAVLHCHQIWPEGLEYAGIDIFRLDDAGKVVEHRDVLQDLPKVSVHENGMF